MAKVHYTFRMDEDLAGAIFLLAKVTNKTTTYMLNKFLRKGLISEGLSGIIKENEPETEENKNDQDNDRRGP